MALSCAAPRPTRAPGPWEGLSLGQGKASTAFSTRAALSDRRSSAPVVCSPVRRYQESRGCQDAPSTSPAVVGAHPLCFEFTFVQGRAASYTCMTSETCAL